MIGVSYFLTNENNQVGTYDRGLKWRGGGGAEKRENIMLNTIVPIHIHVFAVI